MLTVCGQIDVFVSAWSKLRHGFLVEGSSTHGSALLVLVDLVILFDFCFVWVQHLIISLSRIGFGNVAFLSECLHEFDDL